MTLHIPRESHPVLGFALIAAFLVCALTLTVAYIGAQSRQEAYTQPDPAVRITRLTEALTASEAYIRSIDAEYRALQDDFDALCDAICAEGYTVVRVDGELRLEGSE